MSRIKLLLISTFLLCSFSRTISLDDYQKRSISMWSNNIPSGVKKCSQFLYQCHNNDCIPFEQFCDRHNDDCPDGSDEYPNCVDKRICMNYEFRCKNEYCVYNNKVCDGHDDCLDNSDEVDCDINPCQKNTQLCDQICINIDNTYECSCENGYELQKDNKTCRVAKELGESVLAYATFDGIKALSLPLMHHLSPLVTHVHDILAITLDSLHVYWSVETHRMNAIFRSRLNEDQPQPIVTTGLGYVEDIAIDWVTNNIYFIDGINARFGVCTNNGSHCTLILRGNHRNPLGLALDPFNGKMYWSDYGRTGGYIGKANMDGSERGFLVNDHIVAPQSLTIDYPNQRLYWLDARLEHIGSILLDGSHRQRITSTSSIRAQALAVFEDRLVWSNYATGTIESCNKFTGEERIILRHEMNGLRGMHIHHPLLKPNISNPCKNSNCSEICLLAGNNNYTCACSLDKELSNDGHTCQIRNTDQHLLIVTNSIYFNYYGEIIGRPPIQRNKLFKHFTEIVYDTLNPGIFANDKLSSVILRYDMKTNKIEQLVGAQHEQISGMSFDYIGNNLYWSNIRKKTIEIYSLETKQRTTFNFTDEPRNILVIPEYGVMIVAFCKYSKCRIEKLSMTASKPAVKLVSTQLLGPRIPMVYDNQTKKIYWADEGTGNLESIAIDGSNRELLHSGLFGPVSIGILKDKIYWTLNNETNVYMSNKLRSKIQPYQTTIPLHNKMQMLHLVMVNDHNDTFVHQCRKNNGDCSHVCLISSKDTYECACPSGMILNDDNRTCSIQKNCTENEYKCSDYSCIDKKKVCDGNEDCPDEDDEINCTRRMKKCPKDDFQCFNGGCISKYRVCEGTNDCGDWSDEINCEHHVCADKGSFKCSSSGLCIPFNWQCDGQDDCDDGSDEANCSIPKCPQEMDMCDNEMCVHHTLACNTIDDCGDNSDETECSHYFHEWPVHRHCKSNEYRCFETEKCIPNTSRCDGHQDCPNNDDEHYCSKCYSDQFTCNNMRCISHDRLCDHYNDCGDHSDEEFCDQHGNIHDPINLSMDSPFPNVVMNISNYICNNGRQVDYDSVCNSINDCGDSSDEGRACMTELCSTNHCEHLCEETPRGPVCLCNPGFKLKADNHSCEDINECTLGFCSQICRNEIGSYSCDCINGFALRPDKRTCKITDNTVEIISATGHDIRKTYNNLRDVDIIKISNNITGMDINIMQQLLYWSNEHEGIITEYDMRINMPKVIVKNEKPKHIAIDWMTNNIYFYNNKEPHAIMACSQFENKCIPIVKLESSSNLTSLTVDPRYGSIYWSQTTFSPTANPTSVIYRSDMNGKNIKSIAQGKIGIVSGIAIDYDHGQLYWSDFSRGLIEKLTLDGNNRTVFRRVHEPLALNIYEDSVYWVMGSTRVLYACPIYEQMQCQPIVFNPNNIDNFLLLIHITRQPYGANFCNDNDCQWLCVNMNNKAKCVCNSDEPNDNDSSCASKDYEEIEETTEKKSDLVTHENATPILHNESTTEPNSPEVVEKVPSHIVIIIGILIAIGIMLIIFLFRKVIWRQFRTLQETASVSFHNASLRGQTLNDDAVVPIISSGSTEYFNSSPISDVPCDPANKTESIKLHLRNPHATHSIENRDDTDQL